MCHYACRSEVSYSTTTQSRRCNGRHETTRFGWESKSQSDSVPTHWLHTRCLMNLPVRLCLCVCVSLSLCVCLCAYAGDSVKRLCAWRRLINSGGHGGRQLSHRLPSPLSNEAGLHHHFSKRVWMNSAGHFFKVVHLFLKNKKESPSLCTPSLTFTDLQG